VLIIAGFYTQELHLASLYWALGIWAVLLAFNMLRIRTLWAYLPLGVVLWYFMLQSGIHATLAGVLLAAAIPFRIPYTRAELLTNLNERLTLMSSELGEETADPRVISEEMEVLYLRNSSPAQRLEEQLHSVVAFGIIPLFAFANTSLVLEPAVFQELSSPLALGIILGLLVGKPLGVGGLAWLSVRLGLATLPLGISWRHIWGAGLLSGIGFTMSIFITLLALGEKSTGTDVAKLAIVVASVSAGVLGYLLLRNSPAQPPAVLVVDDSNQKQPAVS
jgi:NhaA family Na+:H+ antiporter